MIKVTNIILILTLYFDVYSQNAWFVQNSGVGTTLNSVYFVDVNTGWSVGSSGMILKTTNGGMNWQLQTSGTTSDIYAIYFLNSFTGWVAGDFVLLKTTNGGTSWENLPTKDLTFISSIQFINKDTGWVSGAMGIFKTTNAGTNWNFQYIHPISFLWSINILNQQTGWAAGDEIIVKTNNGGQSWNIVLDNVYAPLFCIKFVNRDMGWSVGAYGAIFKSTNGGANWFDQSVNSDNWFYLNSAHFYNSSTGWLAGGDTIYSTTNGGDNWSRNSIGNGYAYAISFIGNNTGWAVGYEGITLKTTTGGNSFSNLNLITFIEGLYDSQSHLQIADTLTVQLRNYYSPYSQVKTENGVTSSNGFFGLTFLNLPIGDYYLEINHRNSIETWSNQPISFSPIITTSFDMSSSSSQAYGNNLKRIDNVPLRFGIFSGDVNQEGVIDSTDLSLIDNDAYNFVTGYVPTDLTGNSFVDGSDYSIADNNSFNFVSVIRP
ncbi:MAG: Ycf48-like protein [Ignavibacteria bacterium]|nr:Ycf48-like protein [Ignavibacteria bacterium]